MKDIKIEKNLGLISSITLRKLRLGQKNVFFFCKKTCSSVKELNRLISKGIFVVLFDAFNGCSFQ